MLASLVISDLNIIVSVTREYCYKKVLNKKLKLMGEAMKVFSEKITGT